MNDGPEDMEADGSGNDVISSCKPAQHRPLIYCSTLPQHISVLALADSLWFPAQQVSCVAGAGPSGQSPRRAPQRPRKPVQELMRPYYGELHEISAVLPFDM